MGDSRFKIKNGLLVEAGGSEITGSLIAPNITGSLFGTASWAMNALTASFAVSSSYITNVIVSGAITNADYVQFNTASSVTDAVGRLYYDSGEGTLNVGLAGGNVVARLGEDLFQYSYNATGAPLTKGQVVYISGSQGNRIAVKLASATAEQGSAQTLGFVAEDLAAGAEGWIQTEGVLRKLDTTGLVAGQLIYLSSSAGQYTQTKPQAPIHEVRLGYVERISATVGSIYIKIDNGYELDELHNVRIIDEVSGDLLVNSGSLWINSKQLTGSYGLTGSLTIGGSITASSALVTGTITAQTLVVQTITSSVDFVTGSTRFGSLLTDTHQFTGSVSVTRSLDVNGTARMVGNTQLTGSVSVSGSLNVNNTLYVSGSSVGIGTNVPSYSLDVQGEIAANSYINIRGNGGLKLISGNQLILQGGLYIILNNNTYIGGFTNYVKSDGTAVFGGGFNPTFQTSSYFEIRSTDRGFLPPRTNDTSSIVSNVAQGLITYLTGSTNEGLYYYNSGSQIGWHKIISNTGPQNISGSLNVNNTLYVSGSSVGIGISRPSASLHISGSTGVLFEVDSNTTNNILYVTSSGQVGIGTTITGSLYRLDVSGSIRTSDQLYIESASIDYQQNLSVATGSWQTIVASPTSSYKAAFFDYVMFSGSIGRAGTVTTFWSASATEFYENYTEDLGGSTTGVVLQTAISSSQIVLQATASSAAWTIRSLVRLL